MAEGRAAGVVVLAAFLVLLSFSSSGSFVELAALGRELVEASWKVDAQGARLGWSPKGTLAVILEDEDGRMWVEGYSLDSGSPKRLWSSPKYELSIGQLDFEWSRDGRLAIYETESEIITDRRLIKIYNPATGEEWTPPSESYWGGWAPDGRFALSFPSREFIQVYSAYN
ncbi:MAG: hypothetical protein QI223_00505, partial [Candidatus Korarchaeota archaeon]|nr:hypothetical protein [Candidatus Korarchaeota archaeon]